MPNLFSCLSCELVKISIGVGHEKDCCRTAIVLIDGSEPQCIDWALLLHSCVYLGYLVVGSEVEDPHKTI